SAGGSTYLPRTRGGWAELDGLPRQWRLHGDWLPRNAAAAGDRGAAADRRRLARRLASRRQLTGFVLRRVLAPLHPDGFKFVLGAALATILLFVLWSPAGWLAAAATLWVAYFFRDPWRVTPTRPGLMISPADGTVASIAPALPPPEVAATAEARVSR